MFETLTPKQKRFLNFIIQYARSNNKPPTLIEIAKSLKITESAAAHMMRLLKEKGFIEREKWAHRSITLKREPVATIQVPILGSIACGKPIFASENIEGYLPVDKDMIRDRKNYFFLRAVGDSMNDAKPPINNGDFLLVQKQEYANEGELVVALIGDDATVKIYKRGNGFIALLPKSKNTKHKPIIMKEDFVIQGIVKKVIPKNLING